MSIDNVALEAALARRYAHDYQGALDLFERMRSPEGTLNVEESVSIVLNEVACLLLMGNLEEGRRRLDSCVEYANSTGIMKEESGFLDACLTIEEGRQDEGLKKLERLSQQVQDPQLLTDIQLRKGKLYYNKGLVHESLEALVDLNPDLLDTLGQEELAYYRARALYGNGRHEDSFAEFQRVVGFGPNRTFTGDAYYYLALLYYERKAFPAALNALNLSQSGIPKANVDSARVEELRRLLEMH